MPELPEVEVVRLGLEPLMLGRRLLHVVQRRGDLRCPLPERFAERLQGRRVVSLERRAKYILVRTDAEETLVIHLGMTGRLTASTQKRNAEARTETLGSYIYDTGSDPAHDHVLMALSDGTTITYNDPRRFGLMLLVPDTELEQHPLFRSLGMEPLSDDGLDAPRLAAKAQGRRTDLKAFLLDQRIVAGLGNIYVAEALHRARLSPRRGASTLAVRSGRPAPRAHALVTAIRDVLGEAIRAGGSTLRDYRHADGSAGAFQESFAVYDREGEACRSPGCGGTIRRIVQSGRSTFFCPRCQR